MKITVWQQFSSNHSNGFTLVGVFPSVAKAKQAFQRIEKLLLAIRKWRDENPDDYRYERISAPEKKFAAKYGIHWGEATENVWAYHFQTILEIDAPADSWTRRAPYEQLLRIFGADVAGWDGAEQSDDLSEASIFRAQIRAKAKSEEVALSIVAGLQTRIRELNAKEFNIFRKASVSNKNTEILVENFSLRSIRFFEEIVAELETSCGKVEFSLVKSALEDEER